MKKCAFTGHRPQRLPFGADEADERCIQLKRVLREQIIRLIEEDGTSYFITGMAMGIDMYAAEIVLDLKARYPDLQLECAIPYEEQAMRWTNALRERYYDIASKCDKETMLQTRYSSGCFQRRNRYMVDQADSPVICFITNIKERNIKNGTTKPETCSQVVRVWFRAFLFS